jgi:hypothetical protein
MNFTYINYNGIIYRYPFNATRGARMGKKWYNSMASESIKFSGDGDYITYNEALKIAVSYGLTPEQFNDVNTYDEP